MIARVMIAADEHVLRARDFARLPGTLSVDIEAEVDEPSALIDLAVDLEEIRSLHPRLTDARWLDEPAAIGSRAEVIVTMPASLNVLRPIIGAPRGVFTLVDYRPDRSVRYVIDSPRVSGDVQLSVSEGPASRSVHIHGALHAKTRLARLASIPFVGVAEAVIARAANRTLAHAIDKLRTRGAQGLSRSTS